MAYHWFKGDMDRSSKIQVLAIKEILNRANGTAAKMIHGEPAEDLELKEPVGTLEHLANELAVIQRLSDSLLDYLARMDAII